LAAEVEVEVEVAVILPFLMQVEEVEWPAREVLGVVLKEVERLLETELFLVEVEVGGLLHSPAALQ
jgi:uncharacterized alkaline shock family protein YloU